jgi:4-hydroxyphenylpyruvate dioxygenase
LADPYGIVRSRTVASPDGSLCFPLNISESRNTATARSVSRFAGAGVHHIAFRTNDIFSTLTQLHGNGVPMLRIPDNYYDDLDARFDIGRELMQRLRDQSVLYDRSEEGEFFHA